MIWLVEEHQTYNPITLKGPAFLKFYVILLLGFYLSIFILKFLKESISNSTIYFAVFIMILGIVKLMRGLMLGKPVGYLVMILFMEAIILLFIKLNSRK